MADKFHFECNDCRAEYPGDRLIYLCPVCETANIPGQPPKGVLKTLYNYAEIRSRQPSARLFDTLRSQSFIPLLPLRGLDSWPGLRIGETPLYRVAIGMGRRVDRWTGGQTDKRIGDFEVFVKDDSQNPTFSFKDRASALVSAWARENGITTLVAASTGNAGSSLAGICASQGQRAIIVAPAAAPLAKLTQILMYGATLVPVQGTYDDAYDLSVRITANYGWYNRNTAYNPLTIEGKKTVACELFSQLGNNVPDRVFIPVGDGVIFSGVCKGFEDLLKLGIIDRMPVLVGVQAIGSSNLINNLDHEKFVAVSSKTIADSISVDVPRCFHMTAGYIKKYKGEMITVSDSEILQASLQMARFTGIFCEPAAAAAFAGILKYRDQGLIPAGSKNVVLATGSGLKDLASVQSSIRIPEPVGTDFGEVERLFAKEYLTGNNH